MKTFTRTVPPYGFYSSAGNKLMCADGKIRSARLSPSADTWFSVTASVRINGKYVTGYFTMEESGEEPYNRAHAFRHHSCHDDKLPAWPDRFTPEHESLILSAQ